MPRVEALSPASAHISATLVKKNAQAENNSTLLNLRLRKTLRKKLSIMMVGITVLLAATGILTSLFVKDNLVLTLIIILVPTLIFIAVDLIWIWRIFKPIDQLFEDSKIMAAGEIQHRFNIHSNDEFESFGEVFNELGNNLTFAFEKVAYSRDLAGTERNKFQTIFSSMTDGMIVLDTARNVLLINAAAERITGWSTVEIQGKPIDRIIQISDSAGVEIPPIDYCPIGLNEAAETKTFTDHPLALIGRAGRKAYILLTSTPIRSNVQSNLGCVITLRNVDKQKQLESMQLDFVSMASHELRTPITSIKGYLSVFIQENAPHLTKDQKFFLDRIMISTQQLASLVENLLSVSKVERGAFSVNIQSLDWKNVLTQAARDNQLQAGEKNIQLMLDLPQGPLPQVMADNIRIMEVVNNLLSNAINYTPEGGKILVSARLMGKEILTAVSDTGRGIAADALPQLFTKFFRIQGALDKSSNSKGTGLGLYLSKSIIDLHRGKIWATSPGTGKGTTFLFTLPTVETTSIRDRLAPLSIPSLPF